MSCPLCTREYGSNTDLHHLIPKTFKGKETVELHRVCHTKIHHTFSERELFNYYHTIDRLLEHPEIQKFVDWIKNKDPDFNVRHRDTSTRRRFR